MNNVPMGGPASFNIMGGLGFVGEYCLWSTPSHSGLRGLGVCTVLRGFSFRGMYLS